MNDNMMASPTKGLYGRAGAKRNAKAKALGKAIGDKIKDTVGGALSAPARAYYGAKGKEDTKDANYMREARKYKGAPNFSAKGVPTEALKVRTMADAGRMKRGAKPIY